MIEKEEKILRKHLDNDQLIVLMQNDLLHLIAMAMRMYKNEDKLVKNLALSGVVNWLPFEEGNYELFTELAKKGKLLKCYDDGTIIKDGEEEPLAIMTYFAEQV